MKDEACLDKRILDRIFRINNNRYKGGCVMEFGVEAYELYNYLQWFIGMMIYIFIPAALLFRAGKKKEDKGKAFQTQPILEDTKNSI